MVPAAADGWPLMFQQRTTIQYIAPYEDWGAHGTVTGVVQDDGQVLLRLGDPPPRSPEPSPNSS